MTGPPRTTLALNTQSAPLTQVALAPVRSSPPAPPGLVCTPPDSKEGLHQQAVHLQGLMEQAEQLPDPNARQVARECLESLLSFYGDGLGRILSLVQEDEIHGPEILNRLLQ